MNALDFIRGNLGRMSEAQMMRSLGLRESEFRELRAQAVVDLDAPSPHDRPRGDDRVIADRPSRARIDPELVIALLLAYAHLPRAQLLQPKDGDGFALRDLLVWLLKTRSGLSNGAVGRLLDMTEYSASLGHRRYDNAIALYTEQKRHAAIRKAVCGQLSEHHTDPALREANARRLAEEKKRGPC